MLPDHAMALHVPFVKSGSGDTALMMLGLLPLLGILFAAVISDVRERRIPNVIVVIGIATGLLLHTVLPEGNGFIGRWPGALGLWASLQGLAIGAACMFPLYFLRAMGAGDVKLMAAVGAILGPDDILPAVLGTFLAGGLVSLAVALAVGRIGQLLKNVFYMLHVTLLKLPLPGGPVIEQPIESAGTAPYAVAVALGTLGGLVWVARSAGAA